MSGTSCFCFADVVRKKKNTENPGFCAESHGHANNFSLLYLNWIIWILMS